MNKIILEYKGNYPRIEGAGILGEEVNKRMADHWISDVSNNFPAIDRLILEILIEDYNKRNAESENKS